MVEVRKQHSDPTFINALVNGKVALQGVVGWSAIEAATLVVATLEG
jgi:hypothetical protein